MAESETTLDLTSIGRELDLARRSRTTTTASVLVTVPEDDSVSDSDSASSSSPSVIKALLPTTSDDEDQPFPRCLLCFTRPPSAVLLPCCHLNLCYLCAPLLLLKQCRVPPAPITNSNTPSTPPKTPFNIALRKAMVNHPKSRRLSGGNIPLPTGNQDKELKAEDIVASCDPERKVGLSGKKGDDGRIELGVSEEEGSEGKCLVCRAGVSGWLRVYTG